jgi:hypothetical protein
MNKVHNAKPVFILVLLVMQQHYALHVIRVLIEKVLLIVYVMMDIMKKDRSVKNVIIHVETVNLVLIVLVVLMILLE